MNSNAAASSATTICLEVALYQVQLDEIFTIRRKLHVTSREIAPSTELNSWLLEQSLLKDEKELNPSELQGIRTGRVDGNGTVQI